MRCVSFSFFLFAFFYYSCLLAVHSALQKLQLLLLQLKEYFATLRKKKQTPTSVSNETTNRMSSAGSVLEGHENTGRCCCFSLTNKDFFSSVDALTHDGVQ